MPATKTRMHKGERQRLVETRDPRTADRNEEYSARAPLLAPRRFTPRSCPDSRSLHVSLVRGGAYFLLVSYLLYYQSLRCPARHYRVACLVRPLPHLGVSRVPWPLNQYSLPAASASAYPRCRFSCSPLRYPPLFLAAVQLLLEQPSPFRIFSPLPPLNGRIPNVDR